MRQLGPGSRTTIAGEAAPSCTGIDGYVAVRVDFQNAVVSSVSDEDAPQVVHSQALRNKEIVLALITRITPKAGRTLADDGADDARGIDLPKVVLECVDDVDISRGVDGD